MSSQNRPKPRQNQVQNQSQSPRQEQSHHPKVKGNLPDLPIKEILPELLEQCASHQSIVLTAPPGSGKTTLAPLALMNEPWLQGQSIIMLEPRRLAARLSAKRMAELLCDKIGGAVGYRIRHDNKVSDATRIEVVTEGILTRKLQHDPELTGVGMVIFDEFHERSLQADLALALCLDAATLREDLRILVMSATLESDRLSSFLGDAPVVSGEGRSYPVDIHYLQKDPATSSVELALSGVRRALSEQSGDILVFLPGAGEIRRLCELLNNRPIDGVVVRPLYADLSQVEQNLALFPDPDERRRVVLATTVAETSLTIEGIDTVVDLGLSRLPVFDPNSGLTRLQTHRCSKAAADQRAGRAGRLGPGYCYRLWTESQQTRLIAQNPPEIVNADLSQLVLELARWGVADLAELAWLDMPSPGAVAQARELLQRLDLLDDNGRISADGSRVCDMGVHPRLGRLLLTGEQESQAVAAADIAALLSERDIVIGRNRPADLEQRLELLKLWRDRKPVDKSVDVAGCKRVDRLSRRLVSMLNRGRANDDWDIGGLLLAAYPDRLAAVSGNDPYRYKLAVGSGVRLAEGDGLQGYPFLVVAAMDAGHKDGRIFTAAGVLLEDIKQRLGPHLQRIRDVKFRDGAVRGVEKLCYGKVVLEQKPLTDIADDDIRTALLQGIRQQGLELLPWSKDARSWQARLIFLKEWQPDADWPDFSDAALLQSLDQWLSPWLDGITRLEQLQKIDLTAVLKSMLAWDRQQQVERLAPTHIKVPSGSRKRIDYQPGQPPVLAVKLQEMFGLHDTPTLCGGKIALMVHLLSPAQRPVQVTQDLRGFWQRTYQEVKKELKGRYPKHYWPDDPFTAVATHRVRPDKSP